MSVDKTVISGRGHGRGGPAPAISAEQRQAAMKEIEEAPHGKKKEKREQLAKLLGVHPNTLSYMPKKQKPAAGDAAP